MAPRLQLQALLKTITPNVYFQPPENLKILYPCIVYQRDYAETTFADNSPYRYTKRYQLTVIDTNPDSVLPDKVAQLPMCVFQRYFAADNLNHDIFNLFF